VSTELDFSKHFSSGYAVPEPVQTEQAVRDIDALGEIGVTALEDKGYFTRIVLKDRADADKPFDPSKVRVLIVEDDPATAKLIERALQTRGCQTLRASNRQEIAECLARKPPPDLVLLDAMLPDVSGFDVLNRIRQHPRLENLPVLMVTALGKRKDVTRGLMLGATGYITKPVLPSALVEAIETALGG
jgi:CheY-like chemotaxis protein